MGEFLARLKQQLNELFNKTTPVQRLKIGAIALFTLSSLILAVTLLSRPNFAPLFSDLSVKDAGDVISRLDEMKIPYRITQNGSVIEIPSKDVYKVRMELAKDGIPRGGIIGFKEVFEKSKIGATDWERRLQYNQALQGELSRTIQGIDGIKEARVHIAVPEKTLFINPDGQGTPTAAVFLKLVPGFNLRPDQVRGIIHLVSHSVEGLKPENVTVIDVNGEILSHGLAEDNSAFTPLNDQLNLQQQYQNNLELSVKTLLERVFGPGNVAVRVNLELDFNQKTVNSTQYSPVLDNEGILRNIQQLEEHFQGKNASPQGIPGTTTNIPGYSEPLGSEGNYEQSKKEVTKNYEINEIRENLVVAPGAVKKLGIAVVINKQLTDADKQIITNVVGSALGYNPQRDMISVEGIPFDNSLQENINKQIEIEAAAKQATRRQFIIFGFISVLLLVLLAFMVTTSRRKRVKEYEKAVIQAAPTVEPIPDDVSPRSLVYKEIDKLAQKKPESVAQLLRTWLNED